MNSETGVQEQAQLQEQGQVQLQTQEQTDFLEKHRAYYEELLQRLTMMSDMFMRNVLKSRDCAQEVLRIILGEKDLEVVEVEIQQDYKNLHGRSLELDCVALTRDGRVFDIEVEQKVSRAHPKRARYHNGLMDMNLLDPGDDFEQIPEMYMIFIVGGDVLKEGKIFYYIDRTIRGSGRLFGDQSHVIYINAAAVDRLDIGEKDLPEKEADLYRLVHDFHCKKADEMYNNVLAQRVRELKETEGGIRIMCEEMNKIYRWGQREGERIGEERGVKIGEEKMSRLTIRLLHDGRITDLEKAASNTDYLNKLFKEYDLSI